MADCDIVVVGAGHNALICAAYLSLAGHRVIVLERRHIAGGAVVTEEIVPGYKFDLGGSAHILIHHTPILRDLELHRYGLDYIDLDPLFFAPFPDGKSITVYRDIDRTCQSIAQISPQDADAYRTFIRRWHSMAEGMVESFNHAPSPLNLGRYLALQPTLKNGRAGMMDRMADVLHSYGQVLRQSFTQPYVPALIGWMAAQSGPPPTEPFSAPFALWHPMYHVSGMKRPRGGSGMLTQALVKLIVAHGGEVITSAPVDEIVVRDGRAVGARAAGITYTAAKAVVSGAHIHTTLKLLGDAVPPAARSLADRSRTGNGFGMMVRLATDALPDYTAAPTPDGVDTAAHHTAMQFLCPSLDHLDRAYADYLAGRPSREPGVIVMTWSASDPTLAPAGKHVVFLWGQYYPYKLADGASWDVIGDAEADRLLEVVRRYAPNMTPDRVNGRLVQTPLYLERELGLINGNVMHLDMSVDQMFMMRPALTMGNYRFPIRNLYLTGASTHPGGGIMGAAGRNAAGVVLHDLRRRWWQKG